MEVCIPSPSNDFPSSNALLLLLQCPCSHGCNLTVQEWSASTVWRVPSSCGLLALTR